MFIHIVERSMPIFAVEELKAVIEHFSVEVFVYDGMERDKSQVWTTVLPVTRRTTALLISHHLQRPSRQINTHTQTDRQTDGRTDGASLLDVLCVGSLFWLSK